MIYIGYDEEWKTITYTDVKRDTYEVSNLGNFRIKKNKKILKGNNPKNEKNYCRICLLTKNGKSKKFAMHRLVLNEFGDFDLNLEVNHKDGNKSNNAIFNLEESSRKYNAEHASKNDLYQNCDRRCNATLSNDEVENICKLLSDGVEISKIIKILNLKNRGSIYSNIDKIANGKTWKKISKKYNIDYNKYHYKTYKYDDIKIMCECIFNKNMKNKEIVKLFPQYNSENLKKALKSIKARKLYKSISKNY